MKTYRCKGTITVFLSLISVLFLSLLCTTVESARIQGARAKAAAALDMGLFSVFGEFENRVLEQYDVFFLDGASGTGNYSQKALEEKLRTYMEYNVSPNKGILLKGFDPYPLTLQKAGITGVALATDQKGNAFYQQAVGFMHDNLATEAVSAWLKRKEDAQKLDSAGQDYQNRQSSNAANLKSLQQQQETLRKQEEERRKEQEKAAEEAGNLPMEIQPEKKEYPAAKNPLETIKAIKRKGLLGLVLGEKKASDKVLSSDVPSRRSCRKGNLEIKKKYAGLTDNLLFQEYLFERFPCYTDSEAEDQVLNYGLEYILCGKNSDVKNLKSVVKRLLALREGANFMYLASDPAKKAQADSLAALITGAIPVPGLQVATSYALLLVWAYGESLLDLHSLLAGGKVPIWKSQATWRLDLKNIPSLLEMLESPDTAGKEGLDYQGYLQMLFTMGNTSSYSMRALDLIEGDIRKTTDNVKFHVDHAIVKMAVKAEYLIPPVFLRVTGAFLKTGQKKISYETKGTFAY